MELLCGCILSVVFEPSHVTTIWDHTRGFVPEGNITERKFIDILEKAIIVGPALVGKDTDSPGTDVQQYLQKYFSTRTSGGGRISISVPVIGVERKVPICTQSLLSKLMICLKILQMFFCCMCLGQ